MTIIQKLSPSHENPVHKLTKVVGMRNIIQPSSKYDVYSGLENMWNQISIPIMRNQKLASQCPVAHQLLFFDVQLLRAAADRPSWGFQPFAINPSVLSCCGRSENPTFYRVFLIFWLPSFVHLSWFSYSSILSRSSLSIPSKNSDRESKIIFC